MQSLGFAYALTPALRRLHGVQEGNRLARARHLEFFNTHPFLAAAILGCVVRLEETGENEEVVAHAKGSLMGAYGALGDSFYWGGVKPLLALAAVLALALGATWAPWVFVGLFTVANLAGRLYFFALGYREGVGIVGVVNRLKLVRWSRRLKSASALVVGFLAAVLSVGGLTSHEPDRVGQVLAVGLTGVISWLLASGLNPLWAIYAGAALAIATAVWT